MINEYIACRGTREGKGLIVGVGGSSGKHSRVSSIEVHKATRSINAGYSVLYQSILSFLFFFDSKSLALIYGFHLEHHDSGSLSSSCFCRL